MINSHTNLALTNSHFTGEFLSLQSETKICCRKQHNCANDSTQQHNIFKSRCQLTAVLNSHLHIKETDFPLLLHNNKHIHFSESSVFWLSRCKKIYVHLCSRSAVYFCRHKVHHNTARPHSVILVAAMLQPLMCW